MVKKTTSIKIEEDIWKEARKHCIDEDMEISLYLENLIKNDLRKK
ncbi:MAG: hypothetical protein AABW89_02505 [Nanoarchaeota archaeon]